MTIRPANIFKWAVYHVLSNVRPWLMRVIIVINFSPVMTSEIKNTSISGQVVIWDGYRELSNDIGNAIINEWD